MPGSQWRATFFVLEAPSYHWLFGLPLLSAVGGEVLCAPRFLRFRLRSSGDHATVALPLRPRSDLPLQPVWEEFAAAYRQHTALPQPAAAAEAAATWADHVLATTPAAAAYLGPDLAPLHAAACILED